MKTLTETQKAYIAGIIDGEGCVRLAKKKQNGKNDVFYYMAFVCITITEIELLAYLKEVTGIGCVYRYKKAAKENWNPVHRWQIVAKQARELLTAVHPYLTIKRGIAELVLSMPLHKGKRGLRFTDRQGHKKDQVVLFDRIKTLNVRGIKA